jgi:hypothetical protein
VTQLALFAARQEPLAAEPAVDTVGAELRWLDPDPAEGRWAEWLVAEAVTIAIMYRTVGLDGLTDSGKGNAAFFRCERVVARLLVEGSSNRAVVEAEAVRLGLVLRPGMST